jgi:hypothetical protein
MKLGADLEQVVTRGVVERIEILEARYGRRSIITSPPVDPIHVQARLENETQCLLVIIGATPEGKQETRRPHRRRARERPIMGRTDTRTEEARAYDGTRTSDRVAETKKDALAAFDTFIETWGVPRMP